VEIKTVSRTKRAGRHREIKHEQMTAFPQDARHFREGAIPIGHVTEAERHRNAIERAFVEGQLKSVGQHGVGDSLGARYLQHLRREIAGHNPGRRQRSLDGQGKIAAAGREIEDVVRLPLGHDFCRAATPEEIGPGAQNMIGQVVTPRDPPKNRADRLGVARNTRVHSRGGSVLSSSRATR
jgi:hypothetical protein